MISITSLTFACNCAMNLLPLILGLFFKISGTSSWAMTMLSNIGLCVSEWTVEHLKKWISDDAIRWVQIESSDRFPGILVLIPCKHSRALSFLCRGVAGVGRAALERLIPWDGIEGSILKEGDWSLQSVEGPCDAFKPLRDLEGVDG